ncbi:transcription repressor OFP8-like [Thalictrum thalictroides]|uniref:Transcription repressor n=1 Tax=Thalictrum thalictroides TaxID=46969 RepID=A0A7J6X646_THATH|nr:transcription repressor OFP8-like [Thalictrum thalictroides]
MFRSSFGSCRSRIVSDVIGQPVFVTQNSGDLSPKVQIFPSKLMEMQGNATIEVLPRRKVSDRGVYIVSGEKEGRTCPPASPISPLNSLFKLHEKEMKKSKKNPKKIKKTHQKKKKERYRLSFSSEESVNNNGWFSSEDETEDETEMFFSSKSLSSDSSTSCPRRRNERISRRRRIKKKNSEMGLCPLITKGKVEESVAVVKRSSDPYNDFRTSMVEMIIEKQIFSAKDLEKLLQCFLSLNSSFHHRVIVEVFTEIWEVLFS